ncbi:MAG TPA: glycerate kinase [Solirubrobacterales bacterium]|nr:glycerate kinase [Solirubrobacterales bacterium]
MKIWMSPTALHYVVVAPSARTFLVAPDSFKGTFDAATVAEAMARGIEASGGGVDRCPLADGGEGTMAVLLGALGGERRKARVHDPLRRPIEASFGLLADGETAIVELAQASGLPLVAEEERDAERADTYGTGELIAAAIEAGATRVLVAAGGSASNDGGRGALEALRQTDAAVRIEVLCDVRTPFEEAARVFAPQKGADAAAVERLTQRLHDLAAELPRDPRGVPMGGCAGGFSGGLWAHGAELRPGAEFVLDALDFDARLARADAVVSGEGRLDSTSLEGKIVGAVADRCAAAGKTLHLIVGEDRLGPEAPAPIVSTTEAGSLEDIETAASGCSGCPGY